MGEDTPRFRRPWEEPEAEPSGEEPAPAEGGDSEPPAEPDLTDWEAMVSSPSPLDDFSSEAYASATTQEYQGLADEISRLRDSSFEPQAVSATMAGIDTGLVGFEDVTGQRGLSEEDVEAAEQARSSDLALRVGSALALVALFLGSLYMGGWWFTLFLAALMTVALGEFYATVRKVGYSPLALVGLLGVIMTPLLVHAAGVFALAGVAVTATVVTVLVFSLAPRRHPLDNAAVTVFGMVWVGLLAFAIPIATTARPVANILMVAALTAAVDIGSYFIGRGFGSRPLTPALSPNKTVEGFFGGVVAAILAAAVISTFPPYADFGFNGCLLFGLVVALVAPLGDLAESMVKRSLGVKDMGSLLPGHGGMLDRIDSFLFTVPAGYIFMLTLGIVG